MLSYQAKNGTTTTWFGVGLSFHEFLFPLRILFRKLSLSESLRDESSIDPFQKSQIALINAEKVHFMDYVCQDGKNEEKASDE